MEPAGRLRTARYCLPGSGRDFGTGNMHQLKTIEEGYEAGEFEDIIEDLEKFVERKRELIQKDAPRIRILSDYRVDENQALINAAQFLIIRRGGIDVEKENRIQLGEMEVEKWIRNKQRQDEIPFAEIIAQWVPEHAAGWRDNRVMIYTFLLQKESERYLKILRRDENE
ncbi:MAG: hypothetical protein E3J72_13370 [Planctomycetota bacterium]|nr:MAG: hypothetical protein E3J72_13370 [Planctomycetota bacterium]